MKTSPMQSLTRLAGRAATMLALAAGVATAGEPSRAAAPPAPGTWHTLALPVPAAALCQAADLPEPAAPENLLFDLIRVLHERPLAPADFERGRAGAVLRLLRSAPAQPSTAPAVSSDGFVPLPLAPATWVRAILKRRVSPPALFEAILADRRASLLYVGLSQVNAETLDALERAPEMLAMLDERRASALAAFGGSLAIHRGVVRVPGPDDTHAAWETLVGAPASNPARFVPALLERDRGRLAYFFDTLMRLDAAHLRFAVGTTPDAVQRLSRLTSLYDAFRRVGPEWDAAQYPFYRPPVDLATVLGTLRVTSDGRLAPPSSRTIWERALRGQGNDLARAGAAPPDDSDVDASWLLDMVLADGPRAAPGRVAQVRFAQRVFADVPATADARLAAGIAGYLRFPTLMLTLERLGITYPATYEQAARVAAAVAQRDAAILALFQGCLALIDRSAWARSLEQPEAERLAGSLLALDPEGADYDVRLAEWVSAGLLPALADSTGIALTKGADAVVLRALAGVRVSPAVDAAAPFDWNGRRYRIDVAADSLVRLQRLRERQGPPRLDQALGLFEAVEAIVAPGTQSAATARVSRLLAELDVAVPDVDQNRPLRETIARARTRLSETVTAGAAMRLSGDARRDLARARLAVLADTLVALTYLPSLGDPDGPARLGGHVARRHLFTVPRDVPGDGAEPAWSPPHEVVTPDRGWHVEGSLLGLDGALARLALRRLDVDVIPAGPRLDETTRRRFVIDAARTRPFDLGDAGRDFAASGLRAGRARIAHARGDDEAIADLVASVPLDARRVQALRWVLAQGATDLTTRFSLGEILRLGARQVLPFDVAPIPSAVCPRGAPRCPLELTDLTLRLVEGLADRHLPIALLPGVLAAATQNFIDEVQPFHADDLQALWRYLADLPGDRVDDYVAALEGSGPLQPVTTSIRDERPR